VRALIVLLGPTAVGKTALSLDLCRRFGGEILSADSRQIYRGMDIGTAKATPAEQAQARHHLIDIRNPDQTLTVAEYQALAYGTIDALHAHGRVPFLVGGTALYLRAVTLGLRIPEVPPNPALRAELEGILATDGLEPLVAQLRALDPAGAAVIDLRNPRRVLRALEIVRMTGRSKVELEGAEPPPYAILQIGLTRPRASLHARIDARVDAMMAEGLVEETRRLLAHYDPALPALSSLGYREMGAMLRGELSMADAVARIKTETHRFVRNQATSFRKMEGVAWFDLDAVGAEAVMARVAAFLQ
jgi:tRNA dimethylallyltransferase